MSPLARPGCHVVKLWLVRRANYTWLLILRRERRESRRTEETFPCCETKIKDKSCVFPRVHSLLPGSILPVHQQSVALENTNKSCTVSSRLGDTLCSPWTLHRCPPTPHPLQFYSLNAPLPWNACVCFFFPPFCFFFSTPQFAYNATCDPTLTSSLLWTLPPAATAKL